MTFMTVFSREISAALKIAAGIDDDENTAGKQLTTIKEVDAAMTAAGVPPTTHGTASSTTGKDRDDYMTYLAKVHCPKCGKVKKTADALCESCAAETIPKI